MNEKRDLAFGVRPLSLPARGTLFPLLLPSSLDYFQDITSFSLSIFFFYPLFFFHEHDKREFVPGVGFKSDRL